MLTKITIYGKMLAIHSSASNVNYRNAAVAQNESILQENAILSKCSFFIELFDEINFEKRGVKRGVICIAGSGVISRFLMKNLYFVLCGLSEMFGITYITGIRRNYL